MLTHMQWKFKWFFFSNWQFVNQQVGRKPITSHKGEIITLKTLSEPIHPVAGNADCRQPRLGDQKKTLKIKIYVIFFLSAVRKPYWFSDWVQSNVRLSEDWSSLGFTFVVWDRLGEVLEKELPIYNQPRSAGHQLSAQKPPASAVKQRVCQGKDGDRRQFCPKQWALLQEFTFPFFYFICFKK